MDAGHGDAADFANADVKGKLVLLHPNEPYDYSLTEQEFQNAKDAGVAGILIDVNPGLYLSPGYPWMCGPVTVTVTDGGISPYLYDLEHTYEGTIPSKPLNQTVTDAALTGIPTTYHGNRADPIDMDSPAGYTCLSAWPLKGTDPCRADPLIFLRYDGFTAADNSVTASAWHQLDITPVAVKVQASDPQGDTVSQTLHDAFTISG